MIRKNKKFIDPRYFMDEKTELSHPDAPIRKEARPVKEVLTEAPALGTDPPRVPPYDDARSAPLEAAPPPDEKNTPPHRARVSMFIKAIKAEKAALKKQFTRVTDEQLDNAIKDAFSEIFSPPEPPPLDPSRLREGDDE